MKSYHSIVLGLVLILGCKKPFSQQSETALAIPVKMEKTKESVAFIAGLDTGENTYYTNAKQYFEGKGVQTIDGLFSLEEIINWLNRKEKLQTSFDEIHIVSHSNAWLGMSLKTVKTGERITLKALQNAKHQKRVPKLENGISDETKIIFHSCGLGENYALLKELKNIFTTRHTPNVYASTFFNVFGGKYAGHYLAKPYYGYYPTAESPGPKQLSKEFKSTYPEAQINWFTALKTRSEPSLGEVYSFKFNIPIDWEFTFDDATDVPKLGNKEAIMDWVAESPEMADVLFQLNIPLEKYRWKSEVRGKKLLIKGKTTVLCVLEPILQENDKNEYRNVQVDDHLLYQIL